MEWDKFNGMITFTYYNEIEKADEFYRVLMGFEKVIDVDFAKVYKVSEGAHMGIVDGKRGFMKATEEKPVMLTFMVDAVDTWHKYLKSKGVEIIQPPKEAPYLKMKTMLIKDPEGYVVEILEFTKKPYGS
jgi:predicted enzyme related to lactoylglutathione lyase